MIPKNRVGALCRERRLEQGLTQSQLAEKVGLGKNAISALERGERGVKDVEWNQIQEVLGIVEEGVGGVREGEGELLEHYRGLRDEDQAAIRTLVASLPKPRHAGDK
jgi:transcriptional regulator with XRE-family HTH domain